MEIELSEKSQDICKKIVTGVNVNRAILADQLMEDPGFGDGLVKALRMRALLDMPELAQEIDYADATEKGELTKLNMKLQHSRWTAERLLNKIYGAKQQVEVTEKVEVDDTEVDKIVKKSLERTMKLLGKTNEKTN